MLRFLARECFDLCCIGTFGTAVIMWCMVLTR